MWRIWKVDVTTAIRGEEKTKKKTGSGTKEKKKNGGFKI